MKCPVCSNKLRPLKSKAAVVDICDGCKGIWFDKGELVRVVKALSSDDRIKPEKVKLFHSRKVKGVYQLQEGTRSCPRCKVGMRKFNYASDSNVFLDKCPACDGIWADSGEVKAIAQYLKEDPRASAVGYWLAEQYARPEEEVGGLWNPYLFFFPRLLIPIRDDIPRERFPIMTLLLVVLCCAVFFGAAYAGCDLKELFETYGFIPAHFWGLGLISSMFLHNGILHLFGNMLFLWLFGDNVEDRFSRPGYLVFYLCCGLFGSLLHTLFNWNSTTPVVGASGAVSGVIGAYVVFYPSATIEFFCLGRTVEISALAYLGSWFGLQILSGAVEGDTAKIAYFAHIGGFALGALVAFVKKYKQVTEPAPDR